jgi:hypothetical protein
VSYLTAAVTVLKAADQPLSTREILAAALDRGLVQPATATPLKSLDAALYLASRRADEPVRRLYRPGPRRARRGSVRWTLPGDTA